MPPKVNEYEKFTSSSVQVIAKGHLSKIASAQVENMVKSFTSPGTTNTPYTGLDHFVSKEHSNLFISKDANRVAESTGTFSSVHATLTRKLTTQYFKATIDQATMQAILAVVNVLASYQMYLWKDLLPDDVDLKPSELLYALHQELTTAEQNGSALPSADQKELRMFEDYTSLLKNSHPDGKIDARTVIELNTISKALNIISSTDKSPASENIYNTSLATDLDAKVGLDASSRPADNYEKLQLRADILKKAATNPYDAVSSALTAIDSNTSTANAAIVSSAKSERSTKADFDDSELDDII